MSGSVLSAVFGALRIVASVDDSDTGTAADSTTSPAGGISDVVTGLFSALGNNGYQTGTAVIVATVALIALINLGTHRVAIAAVTLGAFWFGWLAWNTVTSTDNQLFPGNVQATKLWDIAFTSDIGFLVVVLVSCVIAALLWRNGVNMASRLIMLVGGVLGASLIYNLYESIAANTNV